MTPEERLALPPSAFILDLVFRWTRRMGEPWTALLVGNDLLLNAKNHREDRFNPSIPVHFDGEAIDGPSPRFKLYKLGGPVWKLSPSVLDERVHAYVTITSVPDPAPWENRL